MLFNLRVGTSRRSDRQIPESQVYARNNSAYITQFFGGVVIKSIDYLVTDV